MSISGWKPHYLPGLRCLDLQPGWHSLKLEIHSWPCMAWQTQLQGCCIMQRQGAVHLQFRTPHAWNLSHRDTQKPPTLVAGCSCAPLPQWKANLWSTAKCTTGRNERRRSADSLSSREVRQPVNQELGGHPAVSGQATCEPCGMHVLAAGLLLVMGLTRTVAAF